MLFTQRVSAIINNVSSVEKIWDFVSDPRNWTASNSAEHRGLEVFSKTGLPETGAMFHQQEYVAGVLGDLRGHFLYVDRPRVCVWTGIATYRLLGGILKVRVPEGGTVTLTKAGNGWELAHDVFMDYSDSLLGKLLYWGFMHMFDGQNAVFEHSKREVVYFKTTSKMRRMRAMLRWCSPTFTLRKYIRDQMERLLLALALMIAGKVMLARHEQTHFLTPSLEVASVQSFMKL